MRAADRGDPDVVGAAVGEDGVTGEGEAGVEGHEEGGLGEHGESFFGGFDVESVGGSHVEVSEREINSKDILVRSRNGGRMSAGMWIFGLKKRVWDFLRVGVPEGL